MLTFIAEKNLNPEYYEVMCDFLSKERSIGRIYHDSGYLEFLHDDELGLSLSLDNLKQLVEFMESL